MSEVLFFDCPNCGQNLSIEAASEQTVLRCPACEKPVRIPSSDAFQEKDNEEIPALRVAHNQTRSADFESSPEDTAPGRDPEFALPNLKIKASGPGESLPVLALLLPLVALCIVLVGNFESFGVNFAIGGVMVVLTAILLAIDAAYLGTTDLKGKSQSGPGSLFAGIVLLWIVGYPYAYFRRRSFGKPNLGPLAVLVAVIYLGGPFVKEFLLDGFLLGDGPPSCTRPEVVRLVDDTIRKSVLGPSVKSISGHREISYQAETKTRKGECVVETLTGRQTMSFTVKWLDADKRMFQVQIGDLLTDDPPLCTSPEVVALLGNLIRGSPTGFQVTNVGGHEETSYDRVAKIRYGRCSVSTTTGQISVAYKVTWLNRQLGQFQVQIVE
jgi:hypothetical protein